MSKEQNTDAQKSEVLQGTLDLMVLKVLDALGPQHGYGIARRIEQVTENWERIAGVIGRLLKLEGQG
jgi:PadR family transcriptional regulator, regulatory protein PadR